MYKFAAMLSIGLLLLSGAVALELSVDTPPAVDAVGGGSPTIFTTAEVMGSTLLPAGTNIMLWGVMSPEEAAALGGGCQDAGNSSSVMLTAHTSQNGGWGNGDPESGMFTNVKTSHCGANDAMDGSGTQILFTDPAGRQQTIICSDNAGANGCGWWVTGSDIDAAETGLKSGAFGGNASAPAMAPVSARSSSAGRKLLFFKSVFRIVRSAATRVYNSTISVVTGDIAGLFGNCAAVAKQRNAFTTFVAAIECAKSAADLAGTIVKLGSGVTGKAILADIGKDLIFMGIAQVTGVSLSATDIANRVG